MRKRSLLYLTITMLLSALNGYGQATSGSVIGTVTDPAGAAIPSAKVTFTSQERGTVFSLVTNESGNYIRTQLSSGLYTIEFEAQGFQRFIQKDVRVSVDRATRVDIELKVGQVTQEISVTGAPPALVTDRAEVSTGLSRSEVTELPTLNRNLTSLQLLMPGAQLHTGPHASSENPQGGMQINANGLRFGAQNFLLDGTDNNDPVLGIIMINPTIESVSEYKYTSSNYDAEFAQVGGAVIQVETKSGGNQFHGSLFEFLQNDIFKARNSFSEPKGPLPLRWNQFGGALGGRIIKNKLFFFGDYQATIRRTGASVLTTSPTQGVRSGDFSAFSQRIFDPMTGDDNGRGRTPFSGNQIPPARLSSQAQKVVALVPLPNYGDPGAINNNFIGSGSEKFDTHQFNIRVDHNLSEKTRYFSRYSYGGFVKEGPPAFGKQAGGPGLTGLLFAGQSDVRNQNFVVGFNRIINPSLLTDVRFGYSRYRVHVRGLDFGTTPVGDAGIPGINLANREDTTGLSYFLINGNGGWRTGFNLGSNQCNCPLDQREYVLQFVNNWAKITGNHTFKWGGDVRRAQNRRIASDTPRNGQITFDPAITGSADVAGSGIGAAAYMLGLASGFARTAAVSTDQEDRQWRMFYFVQDSWRATRKLTLSVGVRWDTWFPDTSIRAGQGSRYDVVPDSFLVTGLGKISSAANVETQWANISPRLGIAYQLNSKTVIRTGFGRSYWMEIFGLLFNNIANGYPTQIGQNIPQVSTYKPVIDLANGPPAQVFPTVPQDGILARPTNQVATYLPPDLHYPNTISWNFSIERLIGKDVTANVAYVGNVTRNHGMGMQINRALPGPGPLPERRPMYPRIIVGINNNQLNGSTHYESLQMKGTKRFGGGLSLLATYTWSKGLTYYSGLPTQWGNSLNHGLTDFDRQHVATFGHVWALPFGKGQKFLPDAKGVVRHIVEGWQFTGVTLFQSGLPFTPSLANTASINSDIGTRPDIVDGASLLDVPGGQSRDLWFNTAAFKIPAQYKFGTSGLTILRGPNFMNADWALFKKFPISETKSLQFRWETFNTWNRTNLNRPNTQVDAGPGNAGRITSLLPTVAMRQMQLALRFEF